LKLLLAYHLFDHGESWQNPEEEMAGMKNTEFANKARQKIAILKTTTIFGLCGLPDDIVPICGISATTV
jgi:hypothetical protein